MNVNIYLSGSLRDLAFTLMYVPVFHKISEMALRCDARIPPGSLGRRLIEYTLVAFSLVWVRMY